MSGIYLGYGVHAEHDPELNQIVLKASREYGEHFIALTQAEIDRLSEYAKQFPPLTGY